jgi:hypothetical protein
LMKRKGWVQDVEAHDRRVRGLHLTTAGRKLVTAARPGWKRAQTRLRAAMAPDRWEALWKVLRDVTNAACQALNEAPAEHTEADHCVLRSGLGQKR